MKVVQILGMVLAIVIIIFGIALPIPEKKIDVADYWQKDDFTWEGNLGYEYVGGDAYNYQMEASLKSGYVSGVMTVKAVTIVGGIILLFVMMDSFSRGTYLESIDGILKKRIGKEASLQGQSIETKEVSDAEKKTVDFENTVEENELADTCVGTVYADSSSLNEDDAGRPISLNE